MDGQDAWIPFPLALANVVIFPVMAPPGVNGPVLTDTASWWEEVVVAPPKTHIVELGQSTVDGFRFKSLTKACHLNVDEPSEAVIAVLAVVGEVLAATADGEDVAGAPRDPAWSRALAESLAR